MRLRKARWVGIACLMLVLPERVEAAVGGGEGSGGGVTNGAIWAGVQFSRPPTSSGGGDGNGCRWAPARPHDAGIGTDAGPVTRQIDGITYVLFDRSCAGTTVGVWIPQPSPSQLGMQASNAIYSLLPLPVPQTAPPATEGVVSVGMWFWTGGSSWTERSVTAWVPTPTGVLWARTTARPARLVYSSGDGATVTCTGPGPVWTAAAGDSTPSPCMHTFGRAGTYPGRLGIEWSISWVSNNGGSGTLAPYVTWAPVTVDVEEIQALVTS